MTSSLCERSYAEFSPDGLHFVNRRRKWNGGEVFVHGQRRGRLIHVRPPPTQAFVAGSAQCNLKGTSKYESKSVALKAFERMVIPLRAASSLRRTCRAALALPFCVVDLGKWHGAGRCLGPYSLPLLRHAKKVRVPSGVLLGSGPQPSRPSNPRPTHAPLPPQRSPLGDTVRNR